MLQQLTRGKKLFALVSDQCPTSNYFNS